MTIPVLPDTERRTAYALVSPTVGPLNVGFQLYADGTDYGNWIEVWDDNVQLSPAVDWTLDSPSGSLGSIARPISDARITFTSARSGTIQIVGARRPRRLTQLTSGIAIPADSHNLTYSDLVAMTRELWDLRSRMFLAVPGQAGGFISTPPVSISELVQLIAAANAGIATETGIAVINRVAPAATALTLPDASVRDGRVLHLVDYSTAVTDHIITLTPASAPQTIMRQSTWMMASNPGSLAFLTLRPIVDPDNPGNYVWVLE